MNDEDVYPQSSDQLDYFQNVDPLGNQTSISDIPSATDNTSDTKPSIFNNIDIPKNFNILTNDTGTNLDDSFPTAETQDLINKSDKTSLSILDKQNTTEPEEETDDQKPVTDIDTPDTKPEIKKEQEEPKNPYAYNDLGFDPGSGVPTMDLSSSDASGLNKEPFGPLVYGSLTKSFLTGKPDLTDVTSENESALERNLMGLGSSILKVPAMFGSSIPMLLDFIHKDVPIEQSYLTAYKKYIDDPDSAPDNLKPLFDSLNKLKEASTVSAELSKNSVEQEYIDDLIPWIAANAIAGEIIQPAEFIKTYSGVVGGLATETVNALKSGRLVSLSEATAKGAQIADYLNKLSGVGKFFAVTIPSIGTRILGSSIVLMGDPSAENYQPMFGVSSIDKQVRPWTHDDMMRQFHNSLINVTENEIAMKAIDLVTYPARKFFSSAFSSITQEAKNLFTGAYESGENRAKPFVPTKTNTPNIIEGEAEEIKPNAPQPVVVEMVKQGQDLIKNDAQIESWADKSGIKQEEFTKPVSRYEDQPNNWQELYNQGKDGWVDNQGTPHLFEDQKGNALPPRAPINETTPEELYNSGKFYIDNQYISTSPTGTTLYSFPGPLIENAWNAGTKVINASWNALKNAPSTIAGSKPFFTAEGNIPKPIYNTIQSEIRGNLKVVKDDVIDLQNRLDNKIASVYGKNNSLVQKLDLTGSQKGNKLLWSGKDVVDPSTNKFVFAGFDPDLQNEYIQDLKKNNANQKQIDNILNTFKESRELITRIKNELLNRFDVEEREQRALDLDRVFKDRTNKYLTSDWKITKDKPLEPIAKSPTLENLTNQIKDILQKNIEADGGVLRPGELELMVNDLSKAVINRATNSPEFIITDYTKPLKDGVQQSIYKRNLAQIAQKIRQKESNKITVEDKIKETALAKQLRENQKKAWDKKDWMAASRIRDEADKLEAAIYKNKPVIRGYRKYINEKGEVAYKKDYKTILNVTGDDLLDYYKHKYPKDIPSRYAGYPGEHWTDRLRAFDKVRKEALAKNPETVKNEFRKVYKPVSRGVLSFGEIPKPAEPIIPEGEITKGELIQTEDELKVFEKFYGMTEARADKALYNVVSDLSSFVYFNKAYDQLLLDNAKSIRTTGKGVFFDNPIDARNAFPELDAKDIVLLNDKYVKSPINSEVYQTPLYNKYTTKEIAEAIKLNQDSFFSPLVRNTTYRAFYGVPMTVAATLKTAFSAPRILINAEQYLEKMLFRGVLFQNPLDSYKAFKEAAKAIKGKYRIGTTENKALWDMYLKNNVVTSNVSLQGFNYFMDHSGATNIMEKILNNEMVPELIKVPLKGLRWVYRFGSSAYMTVDDAVKIAYSKLEYYQLQKDWENAVKKGIKNVDTGLPTVETDIPSKEELMNQAMQLTRQLMPNAYELSKALKLINENPFIGPFASWDAQVIRNNINTVAIAYRQIQNPRTRSTGLKRIFSAILGAGAMIGGYAAWKKWKEGNTDEQEAAIRRGLSIIAPYLTLNPLDFHKEGRIWKIQNLNRINSETGSSQLFTGLKAADIMEKVRNPDELFLKRWAKDFENNLSFYASTNPLTHAKLIPSAMFDINNAISNNGKTKEGKEVFNSLDEPFLQIMQATDYGVTAVFGLGGLPAETKALTAVKGELGPHGEKYTIGNELGLASVGMETKDLDPVHVMDVAIFKYKQVLDQINKDQHSFFGGQDNPKINLPESDILKEAYKLNNAKFNALSELQFTYKQMKVLDHSLDDHLYPKQQLNLPILSELNSGIYKPLATFTNDFLRNYKEDEDIKEHTNPENKNYIVLPKGIDSINNMNDALRDKKLDVNKKLDDVINKNSSWYKKMNFSNTSAPIAPSNSNVLNTLPTHTQEMVNIQNSPMPNQNILNNPQNNQIAMGNNNFGALHNGLTISENALLTPEEQAIRLRERGLA